ncbi:MAG: TetR/AcrR family transcriptional regulator [Bulleidia sp.]
MAKYTKQMLAESLYHVLDKKPLDRIRISDLTEECGVNRQTFYYHFHDIFELIEWIYVTEAEKAIGPHYTYADWTIGMKNLCDLMMKKKTFLMKTYHSASHGNLERVLSDNLYQMIYDVIEEKSKGYVISDQAKRFIADFYKYAFTGVLMDWLDKGMVLEADAVVNCVSKIMYGNLEDAIRKFAVRQRT